MPPRWLAGFCARRCCVPCTEPSGHTDTPRNVSDQSSAWISCLTPSPSLERCSPWQPLPSALQCQLSPAPLSPFPPSRCVQLAPAWGMPARDVGSGCWGARSRTSESLLLSRLKPSQSSSGVLGEPPNLCHHIITPQPLARMTQVRPGSRQMPLLPHAPHHHHGCVLCPAPGACGRAQTTATREHPEGHGLTLRGPEKAPGPAEPTGRALGNQ